VKDATRSFRSENDSVGQFVESECLRKPEARTLNITLFKSYCDWCGNNFCEPVSIGQFGKELSRMGFESYKTKSGNGRRGIALFSDPSESEAALLAELGLRVAKTP
jgi:putative DNA primase/helicase